MNIWFPKVWTIAQQMERTSGNDALFSLQMCENLKGLFIQSACIDYIILNIIWYSNH